MGTQRLHNKAATAANGWPAAWFIPDPDATATSLEAVLEAARRYVAAGLSVLPVAADGSKAPDLNRLPAYRDDDQGQFHRSWKAYRKRLPTEDELADWFVYGGPCGLAVVGGAVSGGLEAIDF